MSHLNAESVWFFTESQVIIWSWAAFFWCYLYAIINILKFKSFYFTIFIRHYISF